MPCLLLCSNRVDTSTWPIARTSHSTTASKAIQVDTSLSLVQKRMEGNAQLQVRLSAQPPQQSIQQHFNVPNVQYFVGSGSAYSALGPTGTQRTAQRTSLNMGSVQGVWLHQRNGLWLQRASHQLQSRFIRPGFLVHRQGRHRQFGSPREREWLPAEDQPTGGSPTRSTSAWGDKIAPRLGIAWDPLRNGKIKVFGGYGKFYDQIEVNLAISSFGGQYWSNCYYALDTDNIAFDRASAQ